MSDRSRLRLFVLRVLVISLLGTLFGRLWYLQVASGAKYAQAATNNREREIVTPATRGQILDDRGLPLVRNRTTLVVTVDRPTVRALPDHGAAVLSRLAGVLHMPYAELNARVALCDAQHGPPCWNGSPYQPIPVQETGVTPAMALTIEENQRQFPGVATDVRAVREYPHPAGVSAAQLLGHLGPISQAELDAAHRPAARGTDLVGRGGLEQQYDDALRGRDGIKTVAVDRNGTVTGTIGQTPAVPGDSIVTSLDAGIQHITEQALAHAVDAARQGDSSQGPRPADFGAAVVMEAQTGRIVAMASYPSYDPSVWVGGISTAQYAALQNGHALLDQATQGQYAPGSTFKVVTTSGAVAAGSPLNGSYPCPSSYTVGGRPFHNFEGETFGGAAGISLHKALVKSCDTVFYKIAVNYWQRDQARVKAKKPALEPLEQMAKKFGLGEPTGVDLPSEASGSIADRAYKQRLWEQRKDDWCAGAKNPKFSAFRRGLDAENCTDGYLYRGGDAANFAIGQGQTTVTPLQLATVYAAVANGGTVYQPTIAKAIVGPDGRTVRTVTPKVVRHLPVDATTLAYIQDALADVTRDGTGRGAYAGFPLDQHPVAGKTGTAEVANKEATAWFASYAPVHPAPGQRQYVAVVMVSQAGQGGIVAAPATREIYDGIYGLGGRPPATCAGQLPSALPTFLPNGTISPPPCGDPPTAPAGGATSAADVVRAGARR